MLTVFSIGTLIVSCLYPKMPCELGVPPSIGSYGLVRRVLNPFLLRWCQRRPNVRTWKGRGIRQNTTNEVSIETKPCTLRRETLAVGGSITNSGNAAVTLTYTHPLRDTTVKFNRNLFLISLCDYSNYQGLLPAA